MKIIEHVCPKCGMRKFALVPNELLEDYKQDIENGEVTCMKCGAARTEGEEVKP